MGLFDGYLLCSDLDGTLLNSRGGISPADAAAIRHFQAEGGRFTLATGRSSGHIRAVAADVVLNAPLIAINGCLVIDPDTDAPLYESLLDTDAREVPAYAAAHFPGLEAVSIVPPRGDTAVFRRNGADWERPAAIPSSWAKLLLTGRPETVRRLQKRLTARFGHRYLFERSFPCGVECYAKTSGKGSGVAVLRRLLGDAVHTVVGVGDYENDLSLLAAADIGYAVSNALPGVRAAADRLTVSHNQSPIAHILAELEDAL